MKWKVLPPPIKLSTKKYFYIDIFNDICLQHVSKLGLKADTTNLYQIGL